ncbi:MAG: ribonuclease J [Candidatus Levybacteria bacterium]|nr:ribonuclease J [Candidatus Levybacteria bacterium]
MDNTLKYISLGGVANVTKNMHLYEYKNEILIVDCGLGFADETMLGVDLVLPDTTYFTKNPNKKIVGIAITHGHEDHMGALPYILPQLRGKFEIFAPPLAAAFANEKLKEFGISKKVVSINYDKDILLGNFLISFIRITHSVPDTSNIFIKTPAGNIYHGSDFKFDFTPYDGKKTDFSKIVRKTDEGVLCLMSDCLGSERPGFTASEHEIAETIYEEMRATSGKFIFTTYSSNISRLNQALDAAKSLNRKVCFVGRSLIKAMEVGVSLGYMKIDRDMEIDLKQIRNYNDKQVVLLVAGSQGQEGSALSRIANGDHRDISLTSKDAVVFSSDPIPGNEEAINALIDDIAKLGARVIYSDISEQIHVSGHGSQNDLSLMMALTRPNFVLPIGGTYKHMIAYKNLAIKNGFSEKNVLLADDGQEISFTKDSARLGNKIHLQNVYVDQVSGEEVDTFVLRDREKISKEGVVIVLCEIDTYGGLVERPNIIVRGFSGMEVNELINGLSAEIRNNLKPKKNKVTDWTYMRRTIGNIAEKFLVKKLKRRPLVLPVVIEV